MYCGPREGRGQPGKEVSFGVQCGSAKEVMKDLKHSPVEHEEIKTNGRLLRLEIDLDTLAVTTTVELPPTR